MKVFSSYGLKFLSHYDQEKNGWKLLFVKENLKKIETKENDHRIRNIKEKLISENVDKLTL